MGACGVFIGCRLCRVPAALPPTGRVPPALAAPAAVSKYRVEGASAAGTVVFAAEGLGTPQSGGLVSVLAHGRRMTPAAPHTLPHSAALPRTASVPAHLQLRFVFSNAYPYETPFTFRAWAFNSRGQGAPSAAALFTTPPPQYVSRCAGQQAL